MERRRQANRSTIYEGEIILARRNTRDVRLDNMSQKQLRKLEKMKKNGNPRKDARSWTDKLFAKLNEGTEDNGQKDIR